MSHGIASGTSSPIGRNAVFCLSHFNMHIANVCHSKLTGRHCLELHNSLLEIADLDHAVALREVIFILRGSGRSFQIATLAQTMLILNFYTFTRLSNN